MSMAWTWARTEWRRRAGSLALLAVLVTLRRRRHDRRRGRCSPRRQRVRALRRRHRRARACRPTASPVRKHGHRSPVDGATSAFAEASADPSVRSGQRMAAMAVAATPEADAFAFAFAEHRGEPASPFIVEGRMFDLDDPHEVLVNESGAAAFGVGVGDRLVLGTVGWDQLDTYLAQAGVVDERNGPRVAVTVVGIHRTAVDVAQQDDPFIALGPAFLERYGDEVIHCTCIDSFDVEPGEEERAVQQIGRLYEPAGYVVGLEEGGALPEHAGNGIDVEVTAMRLLAVAAGIAGLVVVAQAMGRQADGSADDRAVATALGATSGQQLLAGVIAVAPAIAVGAVGSVARRDRSERADAPRPRPPPGDRSRRADRRGRAGRRRRRRRHARSGDARWPSRGERYAGVVPAARRFVGLPAGLSAAGLLGMALATRPDRRRRLAAGGAIVATAVGVAGVLGVWSFEPSRDRLVTEGRLFGADADLAWRGEPDEADRAVEVAASSPGVEAVGVRWGLDADLELAGPDGSIDRHCRRPRRRVGLGRPDDRPRQGAGRPGRGRPRSPHPRRARRRPRRHRVAQRSRRPHLADGGRRGGRVGHRRGRRRHRGVDGRLCAG